LDHVAHVLVLLLSEEAGLYLLVELWAASLSDEKRLSCSSALQSNLGGVLQLADQQVLLNYAFSTFIPVDVARNCLLDGVHAGIWSSLIVSTESRRS